MRSVAVLVIVLAAPIFCFGAVTDAGLLLALITAASWAVYVTWLRSRAPVSRAATLFTIALWSSVGYCALQLLPLPPGILAALSPRAGEVWSKADLLLRRTPSAHPLSVDPTATVFALVTAICVALTYSASVRYAADKGARVRMLYAVAAVVLVFDVIALGHKVVGADRLYGFYVPHYQTAHGLMAPLLNPNHAAALACVAPPILMALAIDGRRELRPFLMIGVVVTGAVAILTLSRGGMLVLALEIAAMGLYTLVHRRKVDARGARIAMVVLGAVGILGAALVVGSDRVVAETVNTDVSKLRIPLRAFALVDDYARFGVGRGAFGSAFPRYEVPLPPDVRYLYVENWPVQLLADMGVVPALAFVGLLAAGALTTSGRVFARPAYVGAAVALAGLVVHDLVDFSMEFAGVGMVAAVLLGVLSTAGGERPKVPPKHARIILPTVAGFALLAGALSLRATWGQRADDEQRELSARLRTDTGGSFAADVDAAILRHPADPHFYALSAIRRIHEPEAGALLTRSVELGPDRAQTHIWLGRWFVLFGRKPQGWAELREASRVNAGATPAVAIEMVRLGADLAELEAMVTTESIASIVVPLLDARKRGDDAEAIDAMLIESAPSVEARMRQIGRARARGEIERARGLADALIAVAPGDARGYTVASELAVDDAKAETYLAAGLRRVGSDARLLEELARRRGIRLGLGGISTELADLQVVFEKQGASPARLPLLKAQIELARGNNFYAARYYLDAWKAVPENLGYLEQGAELAERTGQTNYALSLWEKLITLRPEEPRYREHIDAIRAAGKVTPSPSAVPSTFPMPP